MAKKNVEYKLAKVLSSALGRTSTGKDQLCVMFQCEDGEVVPKYWLFESELNLEWFVKDLKVLGWDPSESDNAVEDLHQTDVLVGREARVGIEDQEHTGKTVRRVAYVNDPKSRPGLRDAMTDHEAGTLGARIRARLSGNAPVRPSPPPLPRNDAGPVGKTADDKLPY